MSDSQAIFALLRGVLEKWIDGCECGGSSFINIHSAHCGECKDWQGGTCKSKDSAAKHSMPNAGHWCGHFRDTDIRPCPTCGPWRELVKELCWHDRDKIIEEWKHGEQYAKHGGSVLRKYECGICHTPIRDIEKHYGTRYGGTLEEQQAALNPDLTTAPSKSGSRLLIVDLMDRAGMLKGLVQHIGMSVVIKKTEPSKIINGLDVTTFDYANMQINFAKILFDGEKLVPAIRGYLEGRVI